MALTTTLVLETSVSESTAQKPRYDLVGYILKFRVKEATNIDPEIFVFHREVRSGFAPAFIDEFYSVASVAEMSDLDPNTPAPGAPFYRSDEVELIFDHLDDLNDAKEALEDEVNALRLANDVSINLLPSELLLYPDNAISRYWGASAATSLTDEQILAFSSDQVFSRGMTKVLNTDGAKYIYAVYRSELGAAVQFRINATPVTPVLVTRTVINENGHSKEYHIYRSTLTYSSAALTLEIT